MWSGVEWSGVEWRDWSGFTFVGKTKKFAVVCSLARSLAQLHYKKLAAMGGKPI